MPLEKTSTLPQRVMPVASIERQTSKVRDLRFRDYVSLFIIMIHVTGIAPSHVKLQLLLVEFLQILDGIVGDLDYTLTFSPFQLQTRGFQFFGITSGDTFRKLDVLNQLNVYV